MGNIQMVGKSTAAMYRGEKPLADPARPAAARSTTSPRHAVDFWLSTEDLPRAGQPRHARAPTATSCSAYTPNNEEPEEAAATTSSSRCSAHLGMHPDHLVPRNAYLKNDIPVAASPTRPAPCRFGTDPATSVLDTDCRAHEVDNLYVVDTSFFPSIGAVNPALTAMANALRVGDHLLERLGAPQAWPEVLRGV